MFRIYEQFAAVKQNAVVFDDEVLAGGGNVVDNGDDEHEDCNTFFHNDKKLKVNINYKFSFWNITRLPGTKYEFFMTKIKLHNLKNNLKKTLIVLHYVRF